MKTLEEVLGADLRTFSMFLAAMIDTKAPALS